MRLRICLIFAVLVVGMVLGMGPAAAEHPCTSPLVLDLSGFGVDTTGLSDTVEFDINGDGRQDRIGWLSRLNDEALLVLDRNRNGSVDHGGELFGTSTVLATGRYAANGFEALAEFDQGDMGGTDDGKIDTDDRIWSSLRLWIDQDHDGRSTPDELFDLDAFGILSLGLGYREQRRIDGTGNAYRFAGTFTRHVSSPLGGSVLRAHEMVDVFFVYAHP